MNDVSQINIMTAEVQRIMNLAREYYTSKAPQGLDNLNNYLTQLFQEKYKLPCTPEVDVRIKSLHLFLVSLDPTKNLSTKFQELFPKKQDIEKVPSCKISIPFATDLSAELVEKAFANAPISKMKKRPLETEKNEQNVENKKAKIESHFQASDGNMVLGLVDPQNLPDEFCELACQAFQVQPETTDKLVHLNPNLLDIYHKICTVLGSDASELENFKNEIKKTSNEKLNDLILSMAVNLLSNTDQLDTLSIILGIDDAETKEEAILIALQHAFPKL